MRSCSGLPTIGNFIIGRQGWYPNKRIGDKRNRLHEGKESNRTRAATDERPFFRWTERPIVCGLLVTNHVGRISRITCDRDWFPGGHYLSSFLFVLLS